MKEPNSDLQQIKVEIVVRDGCNHSYKTLRSLLQIRDEHPEMLLSIVNIADQANNNRKAGGVTPSIWVNSELWFLGSFTPETFQSRLLALTQ